VLVVLALLAILAGLLLPALPRPKANRASSIKNIKRIGFQYRYNRNDLAAPFILSLAVADPRSQTQDRPR
jgi:hypothetical protein